MGLTTLMFSGPFEKGPSSLKNSCRKNE